MWEGYLTSLTCFANARFKKLISPNPNLLLGIIYLQSFINFMFMRKGFVSNASIKYLGFPYIQNARHTRVIQNLVNKLSNKIESWATKPLSQAGRVVMMKSVLLSIPIYMMSCYKLPSHIIVQLHSSFNVFWHGSKLRWDSIEILTTLKGKGGLGLRNLKSLIRLYLPKIDGG